MTKTLGYLIDIVKGCISMKNNSPWKKKRLPIHKNRSQNGSSNSTEYKGVCNGLYSMLRIPSTHKAFPFQQVITLLTALTDGDLLGGPGNLRLYEIGGRHTETTFTSLNGNRTNTGRSKRDMGMLLTVILQG